MTDVFYDVRDELAVTSHKVYEIMKHPNLYICMYTQRNPIASPTAR